MDKLEIEDTKKRFKFLLGSENGVLFRKFIEGQKHPAHIEAIIKVCPSPLSRVRVSVGYFLFICLFL